jgi:hypothetical protein
MLISRSISAISSAATARASAQSSHSRVSVQSHTGLPPLDLGDDVLLTAQCHTGDLRDTLTTERHGCGLLHLGSFDLKDTQRDLGAVVGATTTTTAGVLHQPARKTLASGTLDVQCLLSADEVGSDATGDCSINKLEVSGGNGVVHGLIPFLNQELSSSSDIPPATQRSREICMNVAYSSGSRTSGELERAKLRSSSDR